MHFQRHETGRSRRHRAQHGVLPARARRRRPISNSCARSTSCVWRLPSRGADVAPSFGCQWEQGRPAARQNADAADGDRGALPACRAQRSPNRVAKKIYPYLLRGMEIVRPNQVWAMDITYIPMAKGFVYLAIMYLIGSPGACSPGEYRSRWRRRFLTRRWRTPWPNAGRPGIFNTDQGSQFTGEAFTGVLARNGIAVSMDGKGAWRDNVFVERLWRTVKSEGSICMPTIPWARLAPPSAVILTLYNQRRPHLRP